MTPKKIIFTILAIFLFNSPILGQMTTIESDVKKLSAIFENPNPSFVQFENASEYILKIQRAYGIERVREIMRAFYPSSTSKFEALAAYRAFNAFLLICASDETQHQYALEKAREILSLVIYHENINSREASADTLVEKFNSAVAKERIIRSQRSSKDDSGSDFPKSSKCNQYSPLNAEELKHFKEVQTIWKTAPHETRIDMVKKKMEGLSRKNIDSSNKIYCWINEFIENDSYNKFKEFERKKKKK